MKIEVQNNVPGVTVDCNEWPDPMPMTNADRIRAMSDEEMARCIF